jgi:hypothetical protein
MGSAGDPSCVMRAGPGVAAAALPADLVIGRHGVPDAVTVI